MNQRTWQLRIEINNLSLYFFIRYLLRRAGWCVLCIVFPFVCAVVFIFYTVISVTLRIHAFVHTYTDTYTKSVKFIFVPSYEIRINYSSTCMYEGVICIIRGGIYNVSRIRNHIYLLNF